MDFPDPADTEAVERLCRDLAAQGWHVGGRIPGAGPIAAVAAELCTPEQGQRLAAAATGRGMGRRDAGLRGDSIRWLVPGQEPPGTDTLLSALDRIRHALNRHLFLGLDHLECHLACYPPGAGYVRHRDRFRDDDARVLSLVIYLNADWPADAGGQLRLHLPEGPRDVMPQLETIVWFLSAEIEHEVLAATAHRWSLAGWFRRR